MPRWVLPAVILLLLFFAYAFRWEEGPKRTVEKATIIYKYDRWTGQDLVKIYTTRETVLRVTNPKIDQEHSKADRDLATGIWIVITFGVVLWLWLSIRKTLLRGPFIETMD